MKILIKNRKWLTAGLIFAVVAGYFILAIIPNIFVKRGAEPENMQIIAHRGGSGLGLENTLSCIEQGIASGADMIEIDVHLTKDGHLLVCHDETVDRTTDGQGKIKDMTLDELRALSVVDTKGNITEEHLPTLNEVLELINGRAQLLIEIKQPQNIYPGIEQKLMDEIKKYNANSWVVVQSFNDSVLENIYAIDHRQRLEKLIIFKLPGLPIIFDRTFTRFNFEKYEYIASFNIMYQSASSRFINDIHRQGKEVKIWTVPEPQKTPNLPVDGIITGRPDLWKKL